ncbi:MAG: type II secretion system F family protein [Clostridiales bacterium]|nr:type II secretion system F family protein [Clostridiales bacterium]
MAKEGEKYYRYSYQELSAFCLQVSLMLEAAVPLDEGLAIMAEDAANEKEKSMLLYMAEGVELGDPFFKVLEDTGVFPPYVIRMAKLGQQTGTTDAMMKSLADYYEKEYRLLKAIKNAVTYPVMMVVMLLVVLFVLFSKVMPVFNKVYEQLGAQMSPVALSAIRMGGIFSGGALVMALILGLLAAGLWAASRMGKKLALVEKGVSWIKSRSRIALAVANRRFTAVLALTLKSGMELEKGMDLAKELVENEAVAEKIGKCSEQLQLGGSYYQAMKDTGLFSGFYIQMIKVGNRSGHLDDVMEEISHDYEELADSSIDDMIARFEPTIVAVLAVSVGLVLLSVMLPLAGVLSAIG